MRKLLLLALLLYDIIALASRPGAYDEYEIGGDMKHQGVLADESKRRDNWRINSMVQKWDDRRRSDYEGSHYYEEMDKTFGKDRIRDREPDFNYRQRYEEVDQASPGLVAKSAERGHSTYSEIQRRTESEKKVAIMNCERPHERYEPCFAGCASVSCDNPRDRLRPCYPFCEPGCVCIPPYVRDDRTHKCVLPDDCTKGLKGIPDLGDES